MVIESYATGCRTGRTEKRAIDTILATIGETSVELNCVYTGKGNTREILANHVVMVTSCKPNDALYAELGEQIDITRVGDRSHRRFVVPSLAQKRTSRGYEMGSGSDLTRLPPTPRRCSSTSARSWCSSTRLRCREARAGRRAR